MHLVFYDGQCGLCDQIVQFLLKVDHEGRFIFAPLQGVTASKFLKDLPDKYKDVDSLILVENYNTPNPQFFVQGKAALRICWLLGDGWKILGLFSFLPSFLYNWVYRWVARNRYRLLSPTCIRPSAKDKHRFLP
jgi:predicted DCC family thiol-disulfide oxidoreductase YuxK